MHLTSNQIWDLIVFLVLMKVIILGEFNVFTWIRYGKEYRTWYNDRETFGEYLKRTNGKKGW